MDAPPPPPPSPCLPPRAHPPRVLQSLVRLNFNQEAREADFRYNLVRVRENAESVAFYRGEDDERRLLMEVRTRACFVCWCAWG